MDKLHVFLLQSLKAPACARGARGERRDAREDNPETLSTLNTEFWRRRAGR